MKTGFNSSRDFWKVIGHFILIYVIAQTVVILLF